MTSINSVNFGWPNNMDGTVVFDSGVDGPVIGTSALIHWNELFWWDVLHNFLESVKAGEITLNKWKLVAILEWNSAARMFWKRFSEDDLNRVVNWVPEDERRDNYEQWRGADIKHLIDVTEPSAWLDLHSFSAPKWRPYAFSSLHGYHALGWELWIQNMAINMANANKKSDWWKLLWRWVADYVNDTWANGFTFEAWFHKNPQCYVDSYQALINFLVTQDMIDPRLVEANSNETRLIPHNDIVKIGWVESSHVHIEEKHLFTGWFEYVWGHPQSFNRYEEWDLIWYDIFEWTKVAVRAPFKGYIIMPKDPSICIKWKEVFYYWKDMSEVETK
jgi:hypothetical protein